MKEKLRMNDNRRWRVDYNRRKNIKKIKKIVKEKSIKVGINTGQIAPNKDHLTNDLMMF